LHNQDAPKDEKAKKGFCEWVKGKRSGAGGEFVVVVLANLWF